jgi:fibronectin-binding autotransporter adhesin
MNLLFRMQKRNKGRKKATTACSFHKRHLDSRAGKCLRFERLESREMLSALELRWTGGGNTLYWNNDANWSGGQGTHKTPQSGDSLVFGSGSSCSTTNDMPTNPVLNKVTMYSGFSITGDAYHPVKVTNKIESAGTSTAINADVVLASSSVAMEVDPACALTVNGTISETYAGTRLTVQGSGGAGGTLTFAGTSTNTYTGLTEVKDTNTLLKLEKSGSGVAAIDGGGLQIDARATVKYTGSSTDMMGTGAVTINPGGVLDFNGASDVIGNVTMYDNQNSYISVIKNSAGSGTLTIGSLSFVGGGSVNTVYGTVTTGKIVLGGDVTYACTGDPSGGVGVVIAGNIDLNGSRTFSIADDSTIASGQEMSISAVILNGTVTKSGDGTLTLSGESTYTGGTTISAGSLQLSGANNRLATTGTITITGGTLDLGGYYSQGTSNSPQSGTVSIQGGTIQNGTIYKSGARYDAQAGTVSAVLAGGVGLTKTTTGTLTLSGTNTYAGSTAINGGILSVTSAANLGSDGLTFNGGTLQVAESCTITKAAYIYNGGATIDVIVGKSAIYSGAVNNATGNTGALTKTDDGKLTLSGANGYSGGTAINGGVLSVTSEANLGSDGLTFSSGTLQLAESCTITKAASIYNGGGTIDVIEGKSATYSGVIGNATGATGALTKVGSGALALSGANTYSGLTTISGGKLTVAAITSVSEDGSVVSSAIGTDGLSMSDDGILDLNGYSVTVNSLSGSSGIVTNNSATTDASLVVANYAPCSFAGAITNETNGKKTSLAKSGTDTLTLSGTNTYTGSTTINTGILSVTDSSNLGTGSLSLGYATLQVTGTGEFALDRVTTLNGIGKFDIGAGAVVSDSSQINGTGSLGKIGAGTLILGGSGSYLGWTLIYGGILSVTDSSNLGSGGLSFNGGTLQVTGQGEIPLNKAMSLNGTGTFAIGAGAVVSNSSQISGGSLTKIGAGTLTLSGSNNYSGLTSINGGILSVTDSSNLGSGGLSFNGGTLQVTGTGAIALDKRTNLIGVGTFDIGAGAVVSDSLQMRGAGSLTKTGAGTLTLTGANIYIGGTTISDGILQIGVGGTSGSLGTGPVTNNAELDFDYGGSQTVDNTITNNFSVVNLSAAGILTLSHINMGTGSGIEDDGAGNLTLFSDATILGDIYNNSSGTVTVNSPVAGHAWIENDDIGSIVLNENVTGGALVRCYGGGTISLKGANNDYTGLTVVSGSTVSFSSGGVGTGAGSILVYGNSRLTWLDQTGGNNATDVSSQLFLYDDANLTLDVRGNTVTLAHSFGSYSSASVTKTGSGTLTLSGANTYSGATTIAGGTLAFNHFYYTSSIIFAGGTLKWASGNTQDISSLIQFSGSGVSAIIDTNDNDVTFASAISGAGGLTKTGQGTLTLLTDCNYTGGTTISAGHLQLSRQGNYGVSLAGNITAASSAYLDCYVGQGDEETFSNPVSGQGTFQKLGAGILHLASAPAHTDNHEGTVILNGGLWYDGITGYGNLEMGGQSTINIGSLDYSGSIIIGDATVYIEQATIASGGHLEISGAVLDILQEGTIDCDVHFNAPVDAIGNYIDASNVTVTGDISGAGMVISPRNGQLTLTGYNTYTGGTYVYGTLSFTEHGLPTTTPSSPIYVYGGTLQYIGSGDVVISSPIEVSDYIDQDENVCVSTIETNGYKVALTQPITGDGGLVKTGAGKLSLAAVNTYSGNTTIVAGTLELASAGSLNTSTGVTVYIDAGATFLITGGSTLNYHLAGYIDGDGTLDVSGGYLDATGWNTDSLAINPASPGDHLR